MSDFQTVIDAIEELKEDQIPKKVKEKLNRLIVMLGNGEESAVKASKALTELEDLTNNMNIEPMTRTQLYSIVGILETLG